MSHENPEVHEVDGARTPRGEYGSALTSVRPDDLAALVVGVGQGVATLVERV